MRKTLFFIGLAIFLISMVSADIEFPEDPEPIDPLEPTITPINDSVEEIPPWRNIITLLGNILGVQNSIFGINSEILEVLKEIRDKEISVTIPEKECEWETYSQISQGTFQTSGNTFPLISGDEEHTYITVPDSQLVQEINVTKAYVLFMWSSGGRDKSVIRVNGVDCLSLSGSSGTQYFMRTLDPSCYSAFTPGLNKIYIDNLGSIGEYISIKTMWLEMQVKPANC